MQSDSQSAPIASPLVTIVADSDHVDLANAIQRKLAEDGGFDVNIQTEGGKFSDDGYMIVVWSDTLLASRDVKASAASAVRRHALVSLLTKPMLLPPPFNTGQHVLLGADRDEEIALEVVYSTITRLVQDAEHPALVPDVFLSYSRADRAYVDKFADALQALGVSVWYDRAIVPAERWDDAIETNLRSAKIIIACWSKSALASGWVTAEALHGHETNRLLSVRISDDLAAQNIPFYATSAVSLTTFSGDQENDQFVDLIGVIGVRLKNEALAAYSAIGALKLNVRQVINEQWEPRPDRRLSWLRDFYHLLKSGRLYSYKPQYAASAWFWWLLWPVAWAVLRASDMLPSLTTYRRRAWEVATTQERILGDVERCPKSVLHKIDFQKALNILEQRAAIVGPKPSHSGFELMSPLERLMVPFQGLRELLEDALSWIRGLPSTLADGWEDRWCYLNDEVDENHWFVRQVELAESMTMFLVFGVWFAWYVGAG